VLAAETDRGRDVVLPLRGRLARYAVDEIAGQVVETGAPRSIEGPERLVGRVNATESGKVRGLERLRAEADAVDPRRAEPAQPLLTTAFEGARIGFERDFGIGIEAEAPLEAAEQLRDAGRREQRRRATAEENGRDAAALPLRLRGREGRFAQQRGYVTLLGNRVDDVGVEIAVRTAPRAVRQVNVDREWRRVSDSAAPGRPRRRESSGRRLRR